MKVLFFDSWTKGIHNFLPIANELQRQGIEVLLVHRGSWGPERGRPDEELIDGLICRDITYYRNKYVYKVLKKEKPDVVLILTTNYIMDRAIILAARALRIKSCFLMHGIRLTSKEEREEEEEIMSKALRRLRWQRTSKYLKYTIPNYFYSGFKSDIVFPFRMEPYAVLWNTFLHPEKWVLNPAPSRHIRCDRAFAWANVYKKYLIEQYGYPSNQVFVVGHPPLAQAFRLKNEVLCENDKRRFLSELGISPEQSFCVYLEESFVEAGFENWTNESRLEHLSELADVCSRASKLLAIKLHPVTKSAESIRSYFSSNKNVRVIEKTDLPLLLYCSEFAIGHISTTINIALILDKPVLVSRWGISKGIIDYYISKGVAVACDTPDQMLFYLQNPVKALQRIEQNKDDYIGHYITMTDGKSVDRIIENIVDLCSSNSKTPVRIAQGIYEKQ